MSLETTVAPSSDEAAEFEERLTEARAEEARKPNVERYIDGKLVVWVPQPGSQERFLCCPFPEVLYHGTRGGGKTDCLLMDFAKEVGKGYGSSWRGVLFRETYPQLADVVAKSERWFRRMFPGARFNRARMAWEFASGEVLFFRHMKDPRDYWNYHGHEYPWIGWEELTNWASSDCYTVMFSCNRSSSPDVPRRIRATTNPYGVGHGWVKLRFKLAGQWMHEVVVRDSKDVQGNLEPPRASIPSSLSENKILLEADPDYRQRIAASARNEAMAAAWLDGSWDVVAGGMFDDVWSSERNVVAPFEVPRQWRLDRAFDWGSSKPFSVGWYAQSDGSDLPLVDGNVISTVRGDVFRVAEWYGSTGRPNEGLRMLAVDVAKGIVERELARQWRAVGQRASRVKPGPADSSIYTVENGVSIGLDMAKPVRIGDIVYPGVEWTRADKAPGSRVAGWERTRQMIRDARPEEPGRPRESPGLFVVGSACPHFLRTMLGLPRDEKNLDDVDTEAEDHIADETRYRVRSSGNVVRKGRRSGSF